jgi:TIR domain
MAILVISYSREDQQQVRAVVALLESMLRDMDIEKAVYWDADFEPGDPWFEQMQGYIDATPQLFVFWCAHSARSRQVKREYEYAFAEGKRVVPVLLDGTPMARKLGRIHGIDLRGAFAHAPAVDSTRYANRPNAQPKLAARRPKRAVATLAIVFLTLTLGFYVVRPLYPVKSVAMATRTVTLNGPDIFLPDGNPTPGSRAAIDSALDEIHHEFVTFGEHPFIRIEAHAPEEGVAKRDAERVASYIASTKQLPVDVTNTISLSASRAAQRDIMIRYGRPPPSPAFGPAAWRLAIALAGLTLAVAALVWFSTRRRSLPAPAVTATAQDIVDQFRRHLR